MTKVLENRVGVITGSGAGIGKSTALAMAQEGAKIVGNDVTTEDAAYISGKLFDILGDCISIWAEPSMKCTVINKDGWTIEDLRNTVTSLLLK